MCDKTSFIAVRCNFINLDPAKHDWLILIEHEVTQNGNKHRNIKDEKPFHLYGTRSSSKHNLWSGNQIPLGPYFYFFVPRLCSYYMHGLAEYQQFGRYDAVLEIEINWWVKSGEIDSLFISPENV